MWNQEGELRPQLLDRFGMSVNVTTMQNIAARTQMVLDRMAFEKVPALTSVRIFIQHHSLPCCAYSLPSNLGAVETLAAASKLSRGCLIRQQTLALKLPRPGLHAGPRRILRIGRAGAGGAAGAADGGDGAHQRRQHGPPAQDHHQRGLLPAGR